MVHSVLMFFQIPDFDFIKLVFVSEAPCTSSKTSSWTIKEGTYGTVTDVKSAL